MGKLGYTFYPKDFISDPEVMIMSSSERGIYRDLIDLAYLKNNEIKFSIKQLAIYSNSTEEQVLEVLNIKGERVKDYWTIPSCQKRMDLAEISRENGKKGGRPPKPIKPKNNPDENLGQSQVKRQREREREIEYKKNLIPPYEEFKQYAFKNSDNTDFKHLELKYKSWVMNEWKDGHNNPIKNWKSKLLNTLPHLEKKKQYSDKL